MYYLRNTCPIDHILSRLNIEYAANAEFRRKVILEKEDTFCKVLKTIAEMTADSSVASWVNARCIYLKEVLNISVTMNSEVSCLY